MKVYLMLSLVWITNGNVFAQELEFSALGFDPAYCRLYSYQNGNGVVYAGATGGVPDYSYEWTDLSNGDTHSNTTWGGRNPGCYKIVITDQVGTTITDTLCVDSLNPIANMAVISDDLFGGPDYFIGIAPASVTFENLSLNVPDAIDGEMGIRYFFQPQGFEPFETTSYLATVFDYTYEYGGIWTSRLVAINKNGCTDTVYASFNIFGPSSIPSESANDVIKVVANSISAQINVQVSIENEPLIFIVYNTSGQLLFQQNLTENVTNVDFNFANGLYFYEVYQPNSSTKLKAGKFIF